jgi:hypothetical protein
MKKDLLLVLAFAAAGFLASATTGSAQFVIQPLTEATSKDTKIYSGVPDGNFSSTFNITSSDIGAHFLALVQFDLSQLGALNANDIVSATLRLYSSGIGVSGGPVAGGIVTISPILDAWRENSGDAGAAPLATYGAFFGTTDVDNNAVAPTLHYGSAVASQTISAGGFYSWDITNTVKSWQSGSLANNGVLIQISTPGGDIGFADVDSSPGIPGSAPALTVVPEPNTAAALLGGAGLLFLLRRRNPRATT